MEFFKTYNLIKVIYQDIDLLYVIIDYFNTKIYCSEVILSSTEQKVATSRGLDCGTDNYVEQRRQVFRYHRLWSLMARKNVLQNSKSR